MGVVTYFLLAGYTPFDRDTPQAENEAILAGDYKFEPAEYWANVSHTARDFVQVCLTVDPESRPTAAQALEHKVCFCVFPFFFQLVLILRSSGLPRQHRTSCPIRLTRAVARRIYCLR
jgi:serine/threonine protein kinase